MCGNQGSLVRPAGVALVSGDRIEAPASSQTHYGGRASHRRTGETHGVRVSPGWIHSGHWQDNGRIGFGDVESIRAKPGEDETGKWAGLSSVYLEASVGNGGMQALAASPRMAVSVLGRLPSVTDLASASISLGTRTWLAFVSTRRVGDKGDPVPTDA